MKSYAHLDGVHDDLETLNCKPWSFPKTVSVQVPEIHTEILSTHKVAVDSITMEEPSRLLTIHLKNIRKAKYLPHRTEHILRMCSCS